MSSLGFIEHPVDMSTPSVDESKARDEATEFGDSPNSAERIWSNFDGYAEFVSHMARLQVPIFVEAYLLEETTLSILGQGGTYVVNTGKLTKPLHSHHSRPFWLKASEEALRLGRPIRSFSVEAGTPVVTKRIDFNNLEKSRAERRVPASEFLKPYQTEATILSHIAIRTCMNFPSLLGIGLQCSPDDVGETPQMYPYMIMELGRQGSLEQSFREVWYGLVQQLSGLPGRYNINTIRQKLMLPWRLKLSLTRKIAFALCTLHRHGVVHGDVKLSNTLGLIPEIEVKQTDRGNLELFMSGHLLTQIGDFGSSILLSEVPVGGKARLRSHSPPWDAPEWASEIHRNDLVKTDIYSYGLLFGRIMLHGVSPFDEECDAESLLGYYLPEHDSAKIQRLRDSDKVHEHIYENIEKIGLYSGEELQVIRTVLRKTLRTKAGDRVNTLDHIHELLSDFETLGRSNAESAAWDETNGIAASSLGGDLPGGVHIHNVWDDHFIGHLSVTDRMNVPNLLDPAFAEIRNERVLLREVLEDFKRQIAQNSSDQSHMAEVHYQTAMCHFNGWGTKRDVSQYKTHLLEALRLGQLDALCSCLPALSSLLSPSLHSIIGMETHSDLYHTVLLADFVSHVDMCKAVRLQSISAGLLQTALSMARRNYMEYSDGERLKITGWLSKFMERTLSSGTHPSGLAVHHDIYPQEDRSHEIYTDPPFTALCLAAAEGDVDSILRLFNHLENSSDLTVKDYLNRTTTQGMIMDVRTLRINKSDQSAEDISGPLPHIHFKLEEQTRPLMMACSNGHCGVAMILLAQGADPNQVDIAGRGPLHYLARFDPDVIEEVGNLLLEDQPDTIIDRADNAGFSPLAFVLDVERNWVPGAGVAAARFLLRRGACWHNKDEPISMLPSPFLKAVQSFNIQAMELVKGFAQSSIDQRSQEDSGQEPSTHVVLAHAHHPSPESDTADNVKPGREQSIFCNQIGRAIIALAREPESILVERESTYGTTLAHVIEFLIDSTNPTNVPAIILPAIYHIVRLGAVRLVFTLAAKLPSLQWSAGGPASMEASMSLAGRNCPDMLVALAQVGFKMDQMIEEKLDGNDSTYIFFHSAAVQRVPVELVKHICHVSSLNYRNTESNSASSPGCLNAFDIAVTSGHFELADYLSHQGADITSPHLPSLKVEDIASPHVTILGYVVAAVIPEAHNTPRRGKMLRYLLNLNPGSLVCPKLKMNVFHLVWRKWNRIGKDYFHPENELEHAFDEVMNVFKQLHDHFADTSLLKARDFQGATPLHYAAGSGNIRGVRKLLQLGADATAKDHDGRLPRDYAALGIDEALNYTVSGEHIPIGVHMMELITPILEIAVRQRTLLEQGRLDRVARSVALSRVLGSIREQRQAQDEHSKGVFRTRREQPTEILVLVEILIFLSHKDLVGELSEG